MELITIHKNTPVVEHTVIAQQTNNLDKSILDIITRYTADFEDFGTLAFFNRESTGGRPRKIYNLNEPQAALLMTYLKNTPVVRKFKIVLVKAFYELKGTTKAVPASNEVGVIRDILAEYLKLKNPNRAKGGQKSYKTKLEDKIQKLTRDIRELKAEEKKTRSDFRIERDRANRLQTRLDKTNIYW